MTSQPIYSDLSLWYTLRTRRRRVEALRGMDAKANRWIARAKSSRKGMAFIRREAQAVVDLDADYRNLTNEQLNEKIQEIREVFARRKFDTEHVRQGFAIVREICWRERGERPYLVQIMGAMGMYHGQIVEMATGEGKTLTASVAATMLGWLRRPVHVITVNDYLAQRDSEELTPIYVRAGLQAGFIGGETSFPDRLAIYRLPIVYTTQKELVADWLKDQIRMGRITDPNSMRWRMSQPQQFQYGPSMAEQIMVPGVFVAIVDELDSVLIDEAVTPLIIAQPRGEDPQSALYLRARDLAAKLEQGQHYTMDLVARQCKLTVAGRRKLESLLDPEEHAIWKAARRREEMVRQALVARHCYHLGQHYQIVEDQVVIVDEFTGRFMPDRQWQHGLHQAVEAKHDLDVTADRDTLASMSFQRFFKQYPHLCGMTGTATDAQAELEGTYGLPVRVIPTNRPVARKQLPQLIFTRMEDKWKAIVDEIQQMHEAGRPVLVGTRSIEASEYLSELLKERGLDQHQVLNAVHHKEEAEIVSRAGAPGAIMVATNMAGRGTDIKLGAGVAKAGGLHVILSERHTSRRVDRQLFGRAGRQGDPGSARAIISLEDELVIKYTPKLTAVLQKRFARWRTPLPKWVGSLFTHCQRRAQAKAYQSRAQTLRREEDLDKSLPS